MTFVGDLCRITPCKNGGTCSDSGGVRTCKCVGSYSGDDCEKSKCWYISVKRNETSANRMMRCNNYCCAIGHYACNVIIYVMNYCSCNLNCPG